jgi:hypothetical protein
LAFTGKDLPPSWDAQNPTPFEPEPVLPAASLRTAGIFCGAET